MVRLSAILVTKLCLMVTLIGKVHLIYYGHQEASHRQERLRVDEAGRGGAGDGDHGGPRHVRRSRPPRQHTR